MYSGNFRKNNSSYKSYSNGSNNSDNSNRSHYSNSSNGSNRLNNSDKSNRPHYTNRSNESDRLDRSNRSYNKNEYSKHDHPLANHSNYEESVQYNQYNKTNRTYQHNDNSYTNISENNQMKQNNICTPFCITDQKKKSYNLDRPYEHPDNTTNAINKIDTKYSNTMVQVKSNQFSQLNQMDKLKFNNPIRHNLNTKINPVQSNDKFVHVDDNTVQSKESLMSIPSINNMQNQNVYQINSSHTSHNLDSEDSIHSNRLTNTTTKTPYVPPTHKKLYGEFGRPELLKKKIKLTKQEKREKKKEKKIKQKMLSDKQKMLANNQKLKLINPNKLNTSNILDTLPQLENTDQLNTTLQLDKSDKLDKSDTLLQIEKLDTSDTLLQIEKSDTLSQLKQLNKLDNLHQFNKHKLNHSKINSISVNNSKPLDVTISDEIIDKIADHVLTKLLKVLYKPNTNILLPLTESCQCSNFSDNCTRCVEDDSYDHDSSHYPIVTKEILDIELNQIQDEIKKFHSQTQRKRIE
jgi:hypothetical protein